MKYLILFFFTYFLFSCEVKLAEFSQPDNLITKDTMSLILEDIMVIEHNVQSRYPHPDQYRACAKKSGDTILAHYQINFKRFDASLNYYSSKQEEMQEIYNVILERLSIKLNQLQNKTSAK